MLNDIGLSLCFIRKGSTRGSDVFAALMVKYVNFQQENASLLIDGIIVLLGFACYQDWGKALVGIFMVVASATAVKLLYCKYNTVYVLDILTDRVDEIQKTFRMNFAILARFIPCKAVILRKRCK